MAARRQLRDKFQEPSVARLVEPFDQDQYNSNMSVLENLLFGTVYGDDMDAESLVDHPVISKVLDKAGLKQDFLASGVQIAEIMIDLFSDVQPDSELFDQFSFINADDLPEFNKLVIQSRQHGVENLSADEKKRLMSLPFKLIPARHRLGLITDEIRERLLDARRRIYEIAQTEDLKIEFFNDEQYNSRISIQDNILFGKPAYGQANAQQKINALIADVVEGLDLRKDIIAAGLGYEVGVGGGRLSAVQRQKLGLARALLKVPDLLIVNEALSSLDQASERRLIENVRKMMASRGILWILGRVQLAENFDTVMVMERGQMSDSGSYSEIEERSEHFRQLLAAE
jgi:ABC-type dipeptide/oligopeptide/nickel transport system ATPase subunit